MGDAIANVMAFAGNEVSKEYYINDAGAQIEVLARSTFLRYREALGEAIGEIPAGLYPGDYLKTVGAALAIRYGRTLLEQDEAEWLPTVKAYAISAMMMSIRDDLKALDIVQDVFFSEKSLHEGDPSRITKAVEELRERGFVYQGTLPPPKGQLPEDWEDREQTLLRSTDVGDDVDRPLVKSDGTYTYFAADVAYFADKFSRGFDEMVYVLGADHGGYVKRLEAVAKAVAGDKAHVDVVLCQLVKLFRNGEPVRMSKRAGEFVTLADVVNEVGRDPGAVHDALPQERRAARLRLPEGHGAVQGQPRLLRPVRPCPVAFDHAAGGRRRHRYERGRLRRCADPLAPRRRRGTRADPEARGISASHPAASQAKEPHRLAFYLYDLASAFHGQYNRGKDHPELRFVKANDAKTTLARLGLVQAVAFVIASGLGLIGVHAPEEMR